MAITGIYREVKSDLGMIHKTAISHINDTVLKVSIEAQTILPQIMSIKCEEKLLLELMLCILSSQDKYEIALAATKKIQATKILKATVMKHELTVAKQLIQETLSAPITFIYNNKPYCRKLRFYAKKTTQIISTIENIYSNNQTISQILSDSDCVYKTRKRIIEYGTGIGPKQASMFLRNVGYYTEYAVIDKHIIDYMTLNGLINNNERDFSRLSKYQHAERKLKNIADNFNLSLLHFDLGIWATMRIYKTYHA